MKVFTFQSNKILDTILSGKNFYSIRDGRINDMDMEFYDEEHESYPIYVFCTSGIDCTFPSLYGISTSWSHYMGFMSFNDRFMIELEVPEEFILSMKPMTFRNRYNGEVFRSDYYNIILNNEGHEYEGLIPYICKEHVVAVRTWEGCHYGNMLIETKVINPDLFPIWEKPVIFNGDGHVRKLDGEEPEGFNINYIRRELLPSKCAEYHSYNFCETELLNTEAVKEVRNNLFGNINLKEYYKLIKDNNLIWPSLTNIRKLREQKGLITLDIFKNYILPSNKALKGLSSLNSLISV